MVYEVWKTIITDSDEGDYLLQVCTIIQIWFNSGSPEFWKSMSVIKVLSVVEDNGWVDSHSLCSVGFWPVSQLLLFNLCVGLQTDTYTLWEISAKVENDISSDTGHSSYAGHFMRVLIHHFLIWKSYEISFMIKQTRGMWLNHFTPLV